VVEITAVEAEGRFPPVFDASTADRPGVVVRDRRWWQRVLAIAAAESSSWMPARFLVYVDAAGRDRASAVVRLKGSERGLAFAGRCQVTDLHAVDAEAASAIWRYAGSFDLVTEVTARMRPSDEALPFLLADLRQVKLVPDAELWLHVLNPVAALEGRRYLCDGMLRLGVADRSWPRASGTYQLEVSGGTGRCRRVDDEPDLDLGGDGLGALYLGDTSPYQLAAAGRIAERRAGAVADAQRLLHWAPAAWGADIW
jgi:predicted acetyltransferase